MPTPSPARLVVLVSGSGTNLQALLDATADPAYGARIVAVGADRDDIEGLARAERAGVPTFVQKVGQFTSRDHWDRALADTVAAFEPDLVVSAGFMKLVGGDVPRPVRRPLRQHPSGAAAVVPGDARGRGRAGVRREGHRRTLFVVDAGVDTGPIIAQAVVPVEDDDTVESLHERIKVAEREMLVDCVGRMAREGYTITGRKVRFGAPVH